MIQVFEYTNIIDQLIQEYSCPECCKPLQWRVPGQMSPFNCLGCMQKILDITKILSSLDWRLRYHLKGDDAVKII